MKIGYHISISGGLVKTASNIVNKKMTAVQIFPGSPKSYFPGTKYTEADFNAMKKLNIPVFVHSNYFINLADDKPVIPKSIEENLKFCDKIGASGLVIHMGSNKSIVNGMALTQMNIYNAYQRFEKSVGGRPNTRMLIETTTEGGNRLKFDKIIEFIDKYENDYLIGMCFDTAHMYAAGYDVIKYIEKYKSYINLVHLNNPSSNVEFGKHKDQHDVSLFDETAKFTKTEIENIINLCKLYNIPMIMETGDMENDLLICEKYKG
ncbi:MAG: TIM barrel protein [Ignavibacteria bacterium]|nr:TIM barrel protein [Ignavibacteria bacterium]